jgi:hypothetical protein
MAPSGHFPEDGKGRPDPGDEGEYGHERKERNEHGVFPRALGEEEEHHEEEKGFHREVKKIDETHDDSDDGHGDGCQQEYSVEEEKQGGDDLEKKTATVETIRLGHPMSLGEKERKCLRK